jgi:tetratricopeptide (TPR) repeat protein
MSDAAAVTRPRIGRAEAWQLLLRRRDEARAGRGGLTLLEGGQGVGKSTFLQALIGDSRRVGFAAFHSRAPATETPSPLGLVRRAVRGDVATGDDFTPVPPVWSSLMVLPGLDATPHTRPSGFATRVAEDGTGSELESDRLRLFGALAEPLLGAGPAPVILGLDDLHRADVASLEFLHYLMPTIVGRPVWVVGTLDSTSTAQASEALEALIQTGRPDRIPLRSFDERELGEFLAWLEPRRRFRDAEVRRLFSETGGVPMFVERIVRHPSLSAPAAGEGTLAPTGVVSSLQDLDPAARRVLNLAVVAGSEFSFDTLAAAAGIEEERVVETLEGLVERGVVREIEWERFAFTDDETRYRLYAELSGPSLRLLHRRLAETLARTPGRDMATVYALAHHAYLGRLDDAAVQYNRQAAEFAIAAFQPSVAVAYLEQALDALRRSSPDDRSTELKIQLHLVALRTRMGDLPAAEATLHRLRADPQFAAVADPTDRACLTIYRARILAEQGRWADAERSFQDLSPEFLDASPVLLRIAALRIRGEIQFYRGNYAESLAAHEEAIAVAERAGERREAAAESIHRATALSMIPGRSAEALAGFESAIERLVEIGDLSEAAFGLLCRGQVTLQGHPQEARRDLQRALELAAQSHDLRRLGWARLNLAALELEQHHEAEAEAQNRDARSLFQQVGESVGLAHSLLLEGRLALERADLTQAAAALDRAGDLFRAQNIAAGDLEVDLRKAELELRRGGSSQVRAELERLRAQGLEQLRPDLAGDWHRLWSRISAA